MMKLFQIAVRTVLFTALLTAAAAALGQTRPGDVTVDVPFAFHLAGQQFPAGHYIVRNEGDVCLRIFSAERRGLHVPTHQSLRTESDGSKLVFHRYGATYFLSQVWANGSTTGWVLSQSRAERELADRAEQMELAVVRPQSPRLEAAGQEKLGVENLGPAK
jgi:hypothetical protein